MPLDVKIGNLFFHKPCQVMFCSSDEQCEFLIVALFTATSSWQCLLGLSWGSMLLIRSTSARRARASSSITRSSLGSGMGAVKPRKARGTLDGSSARCPSSVWWWGSGSLDRNTVSKQVPATLGTSMNLDLEGVVEK